MSITEQPHKIPSVEDFKKVSPEIEKFIRSQSSPASIEEIAGHIKRASRIAESYCQMIDEAGKIQYVERKGKWGYIIAPIPA